MKYILINIYMYIAPSDTCTVHVHVYRYMLYTCAIRGNVYVNKDLNVLSAPCSFLM